MPSIVKENYLKSLYHLHLRSPEISISELGKSLGLSKPTVNDMIKKLHEKGWVIYEKYKPIKLTKEGIINASLIIRKHRLSEMFLVQVMGFGWEEVHDIAEELEHLNFEIFFERMDELLGFPNVDPHGSPIPNKNGEIINKNYKTLADFSVGSKVVLKALRDSSSDFLLFLNKKEIQLGIEIVIKQIEDFDKSLTVSYGNIFTEVLSHSISKKLLVEAV
ncbi:metal-dependent transcriptional regulator [Cellulophaga sp. E16_2]|uniref:metal-dependent transcriptional regulator n=1 Tax=Cellulophaga sp. E16_2 TaxID=2789297 RepID=UPI001A932311|nr:metal-dependent transcriptional regulator [Cellulophaga sp. E16_2]MBO0593940.1 metal-dependent transcriptional regulator [Cellulophaga sp. E16_2]